MMVRFEENEYFLMAMFQKESRQATIEEIRNVIPYIGRDEEMLSLINSTLEKGIQIQYEDYEQVYLARMQPEDEPRQIRKRFNEKLPRAFDQRQRCACAE